MTQSKEILRQEARRLRAEMDLPQEDVERAVQLFTDHIKPAAGQVIAGYWPLGREFDPLAILKHCIEEGYPCALPVMVEGSRILRFAPWEPHSALQPGAFGILEPVIDEDTSWLEPDIVLVPMLAFDRRGTRLGQGGGFYDATLEDLRARKDILAVGVAYAQQACLFNLPVEEHDQRLDWVITPTVAHNFE